ncbi:DNA transfer protein [Candidatus Hamiltonella defensa]|uniref:DNA transfer protein n=1 Tax=Candidatus Williamhamiltonella defendens TaxID=138072 RepID=UPI00145187E3|nr:DNA transfer protein [Candidatus Hamiltonella defensa]CAB3623667.1 Putative DNA transfer protein precursor [Bacteriophage APSE-7]
MGGSSGDNGASEQARASREAIGLQRAQWNQVMQNLAPYMKVGGPALGELQNLTTLDGQGQALNQFYHSQPFNDLANQARYQHLNAAEATGGLGSTATGNQLAAIAPALGQNWLSGQMQNYGNLVGMGMNAASGQASAGQNYANNVGQLLQNMGAANAAAANSPSGFHRALGGGTAGALTGASIGAMKGSIGGPWGAAIGGGIGLLGSLF